MTCSLLQSFSAGLQALQPQQQQTAMCDPDPHGAGKGKGSSSAAEEQQAVCRSSQQHELQAGLALPASQPGDELRSAAMMEVEEQQSFGPGSTVSETQLQSESIMDDAPDETELQESQQPAGQTQQHNGVPAPLPQQQQQAELQAVSAPASQEPQHASLRAEEAVADEEAALQRQRPAGMEPDGASGDEEQANSAAAAGGSGDEQQLEQDAEAVLPPAEAGDATRYESVWVTHASVLGIGAPQVQAALRP